jgi:hypothetical protein
MEEAQEYKKLEGMYKSSRVVFLHKSKVLYNTTTIKQIPCLKKKIKT